MRLAARVASAVVLALCLGGWTEWDQQAVSPVGAIDGYFSEVSAAPGDTLHLHVNTAPAATYRVLLYRVGQFSGSAPPLLACLPSCTTSEQGASHVTPPEDPLTGERSAGWPVTDTLVVPSTWTSGYYVAKVVLTSGPYAGTGRLVPLVIRPPASAHDAILVVASVNTWQAYNNWGGRSLYPTSLPPARYVSFDRPYTVVGSRSSQSFFMWEVQLERFLDREGYDVGYTTDVDVAENPSTLLGHRLVITSGHNEYWSKAERDGFEAARDHGVNVADIGGNTSYWAARYTDSYRTLISYKATGLDPIADPTLRTTEWILLGRPECQLLGQNYGGISKTGEIGDMALDSASLTSPWYAGTGFRAGDELHGLVQYEWDGILPGCVVDGSASTPITRYFHWTPTGGRGPADVTSYRAPSGATVFVAGTIPFSYGLDGYGTSNLYVDPRLQQFLRNVFNDLSGRGPLPAALTGHGTNATANGVTVSGLLNPRGQPAQYHFDYGTTAGYGASTPNVSLPASGADRAVSAALSGLQPGTVYHFRLVATDSYGTTRSNDQTVATGFPAGTFPAAVMASQPVAFWRLNDPSGPVAFDLVGDDPGEYLGAVTFGQSPTGVTLNGSSDDVSVPDRAALDTGDTFTIEAWIRPTSFTPVQSIATKQGAWALFVSAGRLVLSRPNLGTIVTSKAPLIDTTRWHHVAATKSGSTVRLYIDGVDVTGPVANATVANTTRPLLLGSGVGWLKGAIGDVALYARPLTAADIASHAAATR